MEIVNLLKIVLNKTLNQSGLLDYFYYYYYRIKYAEQSDFRWNGSVV